MLVTIKTAEVRLGMFVHAIQGGWMASPFWRPQFLLTKSSEIKKLYDAGIQEVVIDTSKGVAPVAAPPPSPVMPEVAPTPEPDEPITVARRRRVPLSPEARAQAVVDASKVVVEAMFEGVRRGEGVDVAAMMPIADRVVESVADDATAMIAVTRLKSKDEYTYVHSIAVAALMIHFGRFLGLSDAEVRELGLAGLLHDIGKMAVPKMLLDKPGKLEPPEMAVLRHHPENGRALLDAGPPLPQVVLDVCLHHHERMDGRGYPHGLSGAQLTQAVRISAICDVYDAVTSQRPYKRAWTPGDALSRMQSWDGHFDPELLTRFIDCIGIHPIGALVRLRSSRLALVIAANEIEPTQPRVRVFYDIPARRFVAQQDLATTDTDPIHRAECGARWFGEHWDALEASVRAGAMPPPAILTKHQGVLS